jgi:aconitase A
MKTSINFANVSSTFSKEEYSKTIDTSFNQLGVKPISQQIEEQPTTEQFFTMYNDLFYIIPELGETNSHEYLIQKSSEYINFNPNQDEIIALQNEIAQLREELLNTQKQIMGTQTLPSNQI